MSSEKNYIPVNKTVARGSRREKNGFYDRHYDSILREIICCATKRAAELMRELDECLLGEGDSYRDAVFEASKFFFGEIIHKEFSTCERRSKGGRIDIELPFMPNMLYKYPFWKPWYYEYKIRSILIEVKNTQKSNYTDGIQLQGYLTSAKRGRFGILVTRSRFTKDTLLNLRSYTEDNNGLILPVNNTDLKELLRLSTQDPSSVVSYLSEKEKELLHVA